MSKCGEDCRNELLQRLSAMGIDATVATEPPLVVTPYTFVDGTSTSMICPHGVTYWMEPTTEQIAAWVERGTP